MPKTITLAHLYALVHALPANTTVLCAVDDELSLAFDLEFIDGRAVIVPSGADGVGWEATAADVAEFIHNEFHRHPATTPVFMRDGAWHDWPLHPRLARSLGGAVIQADQSFLRLDAPDCVRLMYADADVRAAIHRARST